MKLFAYGSNLCLHRLRRRVPSAEFLGRARLEGFRLRFHKRGFSDHSGKANAYRTGRPEDHMWGAVFDCSASEKPLLDRAEGLGHGYDEEVVTPVMDDGRRRPARAYIADPAAIDDDLMPFRWYLRYVQVGAGERRLPRAYLDWLLSHRSIPDPDRNRARANALVPA